MLNMAVPRSREGDGGYNHTKCGYDFLQSVTANKKAP